MTEEILFHEALAKLGAERAAFLDQACAGQPELRASVEALLAAHEASGSLLAKPAADPGQTIDPEPAPISATTAYSSPRIEPGHVIAGRYILQDKIGEGGMGEVWVAKQTEPVKRKVALKLIKPGMDSKAVLARFEQERQALAIMDHPNIAHVLDGGLTSSGRPFFVMDLVNGLPLTKFCDESRLTPKERLELFVPICQAVQHAHQKGIVHRDLKPANILVSLIDGKPVPKVIDFGVAKATGGKLTEESLSTQFGVMVGTLEYMSPEQAGFSGVDVDTRADIYSLGVILYELLTGLRPIDSKRLRKAAQAELIRMIQEEEPSKPSTRLSTEEALPSLAALRHTEPKKLLALLRGELDWVVMKCLEKNRERRYETVNGLGRDIQRYLADEPVEARPPSAGYRLGKFLKRNKGPVLAGSLVLLALVAGIVGTSWGLVRARTAEEIAINRYDEAEKARAKAAASALAEAREREKAEKAEADTLADYRASADDAIEQLIGSKQELGPKEKTYLENTLKRWQAFAARQGDDERSKAIRAEGHHRVAQLWAKLGRKGEARTEYQVASSLRKELVERFPTNPNYQQDLADTQTYLGLLYIGLGKLDEARVELQAGLDLRSKLALQFPGFPTYQQKQGSSYMSLGLLFHSLKNREEEGAAYREALVVRRKLAEQYPDVPAYQNDLATTHYNLGIQLGSLGKWQEALVEYKAAEPNLKKLANQFPTNPMYQQDLARFQNNLGTVLLNLGKLGEARVEFQSSLTRKKMLAEQFPAVPEYQQDLGSSYGNYGNLVRSEGKHADSLHWYDLAIQTLKPLYDRDPKESYVRRFLIIGHAGRAGAYDFLNKPAEAGKDWDRAIELSTSAERPEIHMNRVNSLVEAGKGLEAIAEIAELTKNQNWTRGQWYDFACVYAVASGKSTDKKQEYGDRAMELLQKAVKSGYQDAAHMAKDTDLDSLRSRDDFKKLLAELQKKAPAK